LGKRGAIPDHRGETKPEHKEKNMTAIKPKLSRPTKRHGGKSYLANEIVALMPPRVKNPNDPAPDDPGWVHYCEPFFGAGAVLFAMDPEGISETINDIDGELTNFWDVIKSPVDFPEFHRLAQLTPVSHVEFERACQVDSGLSPVERALCFFILNRQSRQALEKDFVTPVKNRTRQGMQEQVASWLSAVRDLPEFHRRLQRVLILNDDALKVIRREDGPRTIFYLDPPYLSDIRTAKNAYRFEVTPNQHRELLDALGGIKGRFLLSGYHSAMYDAFANRHGWHCTEFEIDNKAASGTNKRTMIECIWTNYVPGGA
jgi:DNA adenine methylase